MGAPVAAAGAVGVRRGRRARWGALRRLLPLAPAFTFLAVFFVYPLLRMVGLSLEAPGGPLAYYAAIVGSPVYLTVLGLTFCIEITSAWRPGLPHALLGCGTRRPAAGR